MGLYFTDATQQKQAQKDILWTQGTDSNDLLTSSSVPALNQKLGTQSKKVIGAVNELNTKMVSVTASTEGMMDKMSDAIGDVFVEGSEDYVKLKSMGDSIVDALENIKEQVESAAPSSIDGGTF